MILTLDLTDEEAEALRQRLFESDKGPVGMGWRSELILRLSEKIEAAIELAASGGIENVRT